MARIFCFTGSRGGCGKTFSAINTAFAFRYEFDARVLYIDANLPISNQAAEVFTDEGAEGYADHHLLDSKIKSLPIQSIQGVDYLQLYSGRGVDQTINEVDQNEIKRQVMGAALNYDYAVVDIGVLTFGGQTALLDMATDIIVVGQADAVGVSRLGNDLKLLKSLQYPTESIRVLINKWNSDSAITNDWLQATLGVSAHGFIDTLGGDVDNQLDTELYPFVLSSSGAIKKSYLAKSILKFALVLDDLAVDHSAIFSHLRESKIQHVKSQKERELSKLIELKISIQAEILDSMELKHLQIDEDPIKLKELEDLVKKHAIAILDEKSDIADRSIRAEIIRDTLNGVLRLGPLEDLLADETVSEVMVNDWQTIFVERGGQLMLSDVRFLSESHLRRIIKRIVSPIGRRIDISSPMVDARLSGGSRVNVVIPPLSTGGSVLTIRKFEKDGLTVEQLIRFGTLNKQLVMFLEACVKSRMNVIISGGTGSGKTTMLNILSSFILEGERVITIEDSAELQLRQEHVITLEARPPNIEGEGEVTIRDLVRNALRMRPDRIIVGECRADEALDMLQAMNTGHDGSMTTIHANSSKEMLSRIETLVMYAGTQLPSLAIKQQIKGAVDIIVQVSRLKDGSRKVQQISEVIGIEGDNLILEDIFMYKTSGIGENGKIVGDFVSTGYVPHCVERFDENGLDIPREMFWSP